MFIVEIPKPFNKVDGKPFRKLKEDKEGKGVRARDEKGNLIPTSRDAQGNEISQFETIEATYLDMLSFFLNGIFDLVASKAKEDKDVKPLKLEDSTFATDIFRVIHVSEDTLELEKAPFEWLKKILTAYGVDAFGINAATMLEPIEKAEQQDPFRAEARRETKKK